MGGRVGEKDVAKRWFPKMALKGGEKTNVS